MPPRCRRHDPRRAITLGHNPALLIQGPPAPRSCRDHLQPRDGRHRRMLSHTPMSRTLSPLSQGGPPRTNTIYVPSVANFRRNWLSDRIAAAQIAALVLEASPSERLNADLEAKLLAGVGARAIMVQVAGRPRVLMLDDQPPDVERVVDLRDSDWLSLIQGAFATLFRPAERPIRVVGHGMGEADQVEVVLDEGPWRAAMLTFSRNILFLSLVISAITASLVYFALHRLIVRPVRRLTGNITAFEGDPEDASRVIAPSARTDEIGVAEQALARMEATLADELRQKRHLAELRLAFSKINHELHNMLATAQLLTDRLEGVPDPAVQRVAPRLVATLGRAIDFCEATLAYGRVQGAAAAAPARAAQAPGRRTHGADRSGPGSRHRLPGGHARRPRDR